MRLSIEVTPEQHRRLKAEAAMQGQSIKDYVLERTLPDAEDDAAMDKLVAFLKPRIDAARRGERSEMGVDEIVASVLREENDA